MTPGDLRILIQEGEGTTLEFKESLSSWYCQVNGFSRDHATISST